MRFVYFALLFAVLSSCSYNRLTFSKVKKNRTEVSEQHSEVATSKKEKARESQEVIALNSESTHEKEVAATPILSEDFQETKDQEKDAFLEAQATKVAPHDVVEPDEEDPNKALKVRTALQAEKDAKTARIMSILAFALLIIPFVSIVSWIPLIVGIVKLVQSNRSRYITERGRRFALTALVFQIIYVTILVLVTAVILAFIFL